MSNTLLDRFGELLMTRVRDKAIGDWERIIGGHMKGSRGELVRQQMSSLTPEQTRTLLSLIPQIVDTTLHHLLWTVEQEQSVDIVSKDDAGVFRSVREVSDGLSGELYSDRGWIARFSRKEKSHM
jgi:hypothetical protein